jgi:enterochelin esterase-like enzyme
MAIVLLAAATSRSAWVTPEVRAPRLQFRTFDSATARTKVSYHIYTPEIYDTEKTRRFPVLYWLHGTGGGLAGLQPLVKHFDSAICSGKIAPMLIVFPNGLAESMWCDSKDGKVPMETVVVKELVPHVDATFRTIAAREGRLIEGFSMGGYGAGRIGFKYPDLFGGVSMLGAGPLDLDFKGPRATAKPEERERIFTNVWGSDIEYYRAQSPWVLAEQNKASLAGRTRIRQVVGDRDGSLPANRDLDAHLTKLGISHDLMVLSGVGHNTLEVFNALGEANWEFYRAATRFGSKEASTDSANKSRQLFFGFSKAMLKDAVPHQQRAWDAVQSIKKRLEPLGFASHLLQEQVRSHDEYTGNPSPFLITRRRLLTELESYRQSLGSNDTIIVYSHSHGLQGRSGKPGGLCLDDPSAGRARPSYLDWQEYADQLLRLPAQTVVVLTMACHSGGLVEFLNNDEKAKNLWQTHKTQGRNFLVITSQNAHSLSNPRRIDGNVINPFTHAVIKAFSGEADGYQRGRTEKHPDGRITLGELANFVVDEAKKHTASWDKGNDPDPQMMGSFDPETVIASLSKTKKKLGIGFGLGRETGELALAMKGENDFVDTMARGSGLSEMKRRTQQGVKVSCVFLSLEQMKETISTLKKNNIKCAYLAYNLEQNQHASRAELDDFVGSVKKAKEAATAYGAPLVVGPGMRFMTSREEDYAKAAPFADVWLIQSQRFQIDKETSRHATPEEYRKNIQRVVGLIHKGNPKTRIWVQIIICPGARAGNDFSAEEIVRLTHSIEDIVDGVRIYTAGASKGMETLKEIIRTLH